MRNCALPSTLPIRLLTACVAVAVSVFMAASAQAQVRIDGYCGSAVTAEEAPRLLQSSLEFHRLEGKRSTTHYRIPVQMHVVRHSDGSGGFDPAEFPLLFDSANYLFEQVNVEIYEYLPPRFIDDDFFYLNCTDAFHWDSLKHTAIVPAAINVYWVPNESNFPYCGLSSFTSTTVQGIVMNNLCGGLSQPFNSTIVHEIGHYFNLYHTHETAFGVECPNGGNCSTTGDLICDTPADPNIYQHVSAAPECLYDNYASTPAECDATPYNPPTVNLMSYSTKACEKFFTTQQIDRFRLIVETGRGELEIQAGSIAYRPKSISPMLAVPGTIVDTTIRLTNIGASPVTVTYAGALSGYLIVTGTVPATILPGNFEDYLVVYDGTGATGACDVGQLSDIVFFQTTDAEVPEQSIPVNVNVVYSQPAVSSNSFGSTCLHFTTPNTPGLGNTASQALANDALGNVLFDASLLLGIVDGIDTVVYQDLYSQSDYAVVDGFTDSTDEFGRQTQTLRFATKDGRLYGDVTYSYGWNSAGVDSCSQIAAVYRIHNLCDTTLSVAVGVLADFDLDDNVTNLGDVNTVTRAVYISSSNFGSQVTALTSITGSPLSPQLRVVNNQELIWPTGNLPDNVAYRELVAGGTGDIHFRDVSALINYGKITLPQNGEIKISLAYLLSDNGPGQMQDWINKLRSMNTGLSHLCGDCNSSGAVSISDVVYLLNYIFAGGPGPMPASVGDVNCSGGISISDAVYLIRYIFSGGAPPCFNCL